MNLRRRLATVRFLLGNLRALKRRGRYGRMAKLRPGTWRSPQVQGPDILSHLEQRGPLVNDHVLESSRGDPFWLG